MVGLRWHRILLASTLVALPLSSMSQGDDWPTFRRDNARSAATPEKLDVEKLGLAWTWRSPHPPQPAWAGPAKWDAYANIRNLSSMRDYDPVFHVSVVDGRVFFGSSADDTVRSLDAKTGKEQWRFVTDGPVRITPSVAEGKLYFGSDDGYAYCVEAKDGKLVWRFNPKPNERRVLHNGRMISFWPVRTGVLLHEKTAYFAASMLPWRGSFICAVDATTGEAKGEGRYVKEVGGSNTFEGAMLAAGSRLIAPQGRVAPLLVDRDSGALKGSLDKGGGGCFAVVTPENQIIHGPGNRQGRLLTSNTESRAKLATYPNGKAMVVAGDSSYLLKLDGDRKAFVVSAIDRKAKKERWNYRGADFLSMIVAGDTVFVGTSDQVIALNAKTGKESWRGDVKGKVFGMAVADGALFASTDEGTIHCFRPGDLNAAVADRDKDKPAVTDSSGETAKAAVPRFTHPALSSRWVFHGAALRDVRGKPVRQLGKLSGASAKDLKGNVDGRVVGSPVLESTGRLESLKFDGSTTSVMLTEDHKTAKLPTKEMTAEAWVRIDKPLEWGGIIGAIQDNGNFERGWILGFQRDKLSFGVNCTGGKDAITYLTARTPFTVGRWHHVVGTYDGTTQRIYVDGKLENSSTEQKGVIKYPPKTFFVIGSYHDDNENHRLTGGINEVRLYGRALAAAEVVAHYKSRKLLLPTTVLAASKKPEIKRLTLAAGPLLQFVDRRTAVVRWETEMRTPTVLELSLNGEMKRVVEPKLKMEHEVTLENLKRNSLYQFVIKDAVKGELSSREFECDTFFNYDTKSPIVERKNPFVSLASAKTSAAAADKILGNTKIDRGICLVLGSRTGNLAYELAVRSRLRVICVDTDAERVSKAHNVLHEAGVYGPRVSAHVVESLDALPFPSNFANLIVSEAVLETGEPIGSAKEMYRVLRPDGGVAFLGQQSGDTKRLTSWFETADVDAEMKPVAGGWTKLVRPALDGAGQWTHLYGDSHNAAYGGEKLSGAGAVSEFVTQWLGRPGPRFQPDRNGRKPGPLSVGGRLFAQGLHRIVATDAYNGTILWSAEIPDMLRMNMPRDSSNWCVDRDYVYVAIRDRVWRFDASNGTRSHMYFVEPGANSEWAYDWSFIASHNDLLVGSAVKKDAAFTGFWGKGDWYDAPKGPQTDKVCSDNLFALDKKTGAKAWEYTGGVVINPTITIGDGRVYFVECRNSKIRAAEKRRIGDPELWQDQFMVAIDVKTGRKLWERAIDTHDGVTIFSLAHGGEKLSLVASGSGKFHVYAYNSKDGAPTWDYAWGWPGGKHDHGKAMSRPAIVGNTLYVRPKAFELSTGKVLDKTVPGGGCGTYACTEHSLFFRAGNVTMWDSRNGASSSWSRLRPGCWLSTIPAAGMLLSPEAGGGCSCGNWLETSIAMAPREKPKQKKP